MTKLVWAPPFIWTLCIAVSSCHAHLLQLTITTPIPTAHFTTWISLLHSSVLPDSTPGYFLGAVDAQDAQKACRLIKEGQQSVTATVTANGETSDRQIQLVANRGCDASRNSPVGVEIVFTGKTGRTNVLICDESALSAGCAIYKTGEDVNSIYDDAISNNIAVTSMDNDARGSAGFVLGVDTAAANCHAFGQAIAVLCAPAVVLVSRSKDICVFCYDCFPGDATVLTSTGQSKYMSELSVGDEVAVLGNHQTIQFQSIYVFGHADNKSMGSYIKLQLETASQEEDLQGFSFSKILYISPLHFAPVISEGHTQMIYKRAKDIAIGDLMLITDDLKKVITHAYVTGKSKTLKKGLYNPYTMGGTIIVDGVIASAHSDSYLDVILDNFSLTQYIPMVYQVVLSPLRILYHILGRHYYVLVYQYVDKLCGIPTMGRNRGGQLSQILVTFTTFLLIMTVRYYFKKKDVLPCKQARIVDHGLT